MGTEYFAMIVDRITLKLELSRIQLS